MATTASKKKWYLVSELYGVECTRIEEGWGAVRALINAGGKPRFRQASCRERAEEIRDEILFARAKRDGKDYIRTCARGGKAHAGRTGAMHLA